MTIVKYSIHLKTFQDKWRGHEASSTHPLPTSLSFQLKHRNKTYLLFIFQDSHFSKQIRQGENGTGEHAKKRAEETLGMNWAGRWPSTSPKRSLTSRLYYLLKFPNDLLPTKLYVSSKNVFFSMAIHNRQAYVQV